MPPAKVIYDLRAEARVGLGKDRRGKRTTVSGAVNEILAGEMRKLVSLTTDLHVASLVFRHGAFRSTPYFHSALIPIH